jgi:hypothetical protein
MTLHEVRDALLEEFPSHQSFIRWSRPVTMDGLTIMNETPKDAPDYIRWVKICWKGDYVSRIEFDHDIRKWSENRRHLAFRIFKELEKFNG